MESKLEKLGDDILISIVRLISFKDAIRMSVVSKNMQRLFTYHTNLYFDGSNSHGSKGDQFFSSVSRVLSSYRQPFMDGFRVCFPLCNSPDCAKIDTWIKFALDKGVTTLELELNFSDDRVYRLPIDVLTSPPLESRLKLLKSLSLKQVDIRRKNIDDLISRCTLLERLHVEDLRVVPFFFSFTSDSLKYLKIKGSYHYSRIYINAENLVHLEICGVSKYIFVNNEPKVVEAFIGGNYCDNLLHDYSPLYDLSPHLSKLCLDCDLATFQWHSDYKVPTLENLKDLVLRVSLSEYHVASFFKLLSTFFKACPLLQNTRLETEWLKSDSESIIEESESSWNAEEKSEDYTPKDVREWLEVREDVFEPIPKLQVLEWRGYFEEDVPVVLYIIKNAIKLEKLVLDPRSPLIRPSSVVDEVQDISRENVLRLAAVIPKHVEITIL